MVNQRIDVPAELVMPAVSGLLVEGAVDALEPAADRIAGGRVGENIEPVGQNRVGRQASDVADAHTVVLLGDGRRRLGGVGRRRFFAVPAADSPRVCGEVGFDDHRAQDRHSDPVGFDLAGQGLGEADDAVLGHPVCAEARIGYQPGERRGKDDVAAAALLEQPR